MEVPEEVMEVQEESVPYHLSNCPKLSSIRNLKIQHIIQKLKFCFENEYEM